MNITWCINDYPAPAKILISLLIYSLIYSFTYLMLPIFYKPKRLRPLLFRAFAPKLILFTLVGWLSIFPLSTDLWTINSTISVNNIPAIVLFFTLAFIITSFFHHHILSIKPNATWRVVIIRITYYYLIGFPYSILFGFYLLALTYPGVYKDVPIFSQDNPHIRELHMQLQNIAKNKHNKVYQDSLKSYLTNLSKFPPKHMMEIQYGSNYFYNSITSREFQEIISYFDNCDSLGLKNKCKAIQDTNQLDQKSHEKLILDKICNEEGSHSLLPSIVKINLFAIPYTFPRLLFLGGLLAFVIGFFIQFVLPQENT